MLAGFDHVAVEVDEALVVGGQHGDVIEGLELEVCVGNPDAVPGRIDPPGTPAARYHVG